MAHRTEHPLAGRVVVPESCLATGEPVYVVDWADRVPRITQTLPPDAVLDATDVLIRDADGHRCIPVYDLPLYDPLPIGFVS